LATDEINILNCFKKEYKDKLLFYEGVIRSSIKEEVYLQNNNSFKLGEDVLIDCLLLSKCSKIVCTKSNVSISAFGFSDLLYEDITFLDIDNKIVR
jgi:Tfp pilus assembly protein PilZ